MGHGQSSQLPATLQEMTLSQLISSMGGTVSGMGVPHIKLGDIFSSLGYLWNGDYEKAMAAVIDTTLDPSGINIVRTFKEGVCSDCTILAAKTDIVFADGKRADVSEGVYLHHLTNMNLGSKDVAAWLNLCPTSQTTILGYDITQNIPTTIRGPFQPLAMATVDEYTQVSPNTS